MRLSTDNVARLNPGRLGRLADRIACQSAVLSNRRVVPAAF